MERQKFEDNIKDAFSNAELNPSPQVWNSIELGIVKAESEKLKQRMLFFKMLAAASVVFAMAIAGASVWYSQQSSLSSDQLAYRDDRSATAENDRIRSNEEKITNEEEINGAGSKEEVKTNEELNDNGSNEEKNNSSASIDRNEDVSGQVKIGETETKDVKERNVRSLRRQKGGVQQTPTADADQQNSNNVASNNNSIAGNDVRKSDIVDRNNNGGQDMTSQVASIDAANNQEANVIDENRSLLIPVRQLQLAYIPPVEIHLPEEPKPDAVALMLARLNDFEKEQQKKDKKEKSSSKEKLWTSVGFAAGAFTGGNASVSTKSSAMSTLVANTSDDIADKEANAAGITYSVGVNMGTSLAKRWVLQGGVNYMTQSSDYTVENAFGSADLKTFTPASINGIDQIKDDPEAADAKMVTTAPYNVNNNVQYLSIPLQAGYLIVNKKFGVQLNAGVSTDMFLKNQKTADGDNLQKIDQGRSDSPYRPFNFSGLMGAEFTYKLGHRYRVALNPGMRYPFSSIYKSDVGVKATPLTYDVGLRFRYIFQ